MIFIGSLSWHSVCSFDIKVVLCIVFRFERKHSNSHDNLL